MISQECPKLPPRPLLYWNSAIIYPGSRGIFPPILIPISQRTWVLAPGSIPSCSYERSRRWSGKFSGWPQRRGSSPGYCSGWRRGAGRKNCRLFCSVHRERLGRRPVDRPARYDECRPSVLSISWAWTELESFNGVLAWTTQAIDAVNSMFREAAFMGMTVLAASGDNGSNCQISDKNAHVYYPSSDHWVTSLRWNCSISRNVSGSAFTETTWNDNGITGGGISDIFDLPLWQTEAGIPLSVNANKRKGRGIPDIAGYANGYTIVLHGSNSPGWWGTSETAPLSCRAHRRDQCLPEVATL